MYNCIFSGHCTNLSCDKSCPTLAETTYLLDRNHISMSSDVFNTPPEKLNQYMKVLDKSSGTHHTLITGDTVKAAELLTYCSICQNWKGSRLHCTVYNLKFSQYVEAIQNSWSSKVETEQLEYMKIWASSAKVLIISNIDYVNFRDFQCQTLLTLLQSRASSEYTTIIVSPSVSMLVGDGQFFQRLCGLLSAKDKSTDETEKASNQKGGSTR